MGKVNELELGAHYNVVKPHTRNFSIHLGRVHCFFIIIVLDRPASSAHLFEHEESKKRHGEVEKVVYHDSPIELLKIFMIKLFPVIQLVKEFMTISATYPD